MRKRILITGISGNMGNKAIPLLAKQKLVTIRLLLEDSQKKRSKELSALGFELAFADICNYSQVKAAVKDCDMVIHMAALVSPRADYMPELTMAVNVQGTANVIKAIKAHRGTDKTRLVYIGSIAEYGNRTPPIHFVQCGDPIKISAFDLYAESKVKAERLLIESGLQYWVSLRQSGVLHENLMTRMDPIIFHQPLNTHIEWTNSEDCARLIYKLALSEAENTLSESFWKNVYNISSGTDHRTTYYDFLDRMFYAAGLGDYTQILQPKDFSLGNFHCGWFIDADRLEEHLHFRQTSYQVFWNRLKTKLGKMRVLLTLIPQKLIRLLYFKNIAMADRAPGGWIHNKSQDFITAFLGSTDNYNQIPESWSNFPYQTNPRADIILQGFDHFKEDRELTYKDLFSALDFRNAQLVDAVDRDAATRLSESKRSLDTRFTIRCSRNHVFTASARLILRSGHFCPECDCDWKSYKDRAASEPFFRQVFRPAELPDITKRSLYTETQPQNSFSRHHKAEV